MRDFDNSVGLIPAFTFVSWVGCAIVGVAGLLGPPMQSASPTTRPVEATPVEVSLVTPPTESTMLSPSLDATTPTLETPAAEAPPAPAAIAPSSAVAYAAPINVAATVASISTTAKPAPLPARRHEGKPGGVRQLTLGTGEGRQPAPEYPVDAALAGHQGSVGILFSVDTTGHVTQANVELGSGWPTLNQAALDVVRDSWRFAPGAMRTFRVTIEFRLTH